MLTQTIRIQFTCPQCDFPFETDIIDTKPPSSELVESLIKETLDPHFISVHKDELGVC